MQPEIDEVAEALGLPELPEEPAEPPADEPVEPVETAAEPDAEPAEPAEEAEPEPEPDIRTVMANLEDLKKANSGVVEALRRERHARQEAEAERRKVMEDLSAAAKKEQDEEKASQRPDKDEDPSGYLEAVLTERLGALDEKIQSLDEQNAAVNNERQQQALVDAVNRDEAALAAEHPDYYEALDYVRGRRREMAKSMNPSLDDGALDQWIAQSDQQFALQAMQNNQMPAKAAWDVALSMGYTPQSVGNGDAPAVPASAPSSAPSSPPAATSLSTAHPSPRSRSGGKKIRLKDWDGLDKRTQNAILDDEDMFREIQETGEIHLPA